MFKVNAVYCFKSKAACEAFSMISDENFKMAALIEGSCFRVEDVSESGSVCSLTLLDSGDIVEAGQYPFRSWEILLARGERNFFMCVSAGEVVKETKDVSVYNSEFISYSEYQHLEGIVGHLLSLIDTECDLPESLKEELKALDLL